MKYAVFANGSRQYKAEEGEEILVDSLGLGEDEKKVAFDQVLLVVDGDNVKVGNPVVTGAKVSASVLGEVKGEKIDVIKYKSKSRYRKHTGHRHLYTKVKVDKITS